MFKLWLKANLSILIGALFLKTVTYNNPNLKFAIDPMLMFVVLMVSSAIATIIIKTLMKYRSEWFEKEE